jgi:hypothetical protein
MASQDDQLKLDVLQRTLVKELAKDHPDLALIHALDREINNLVLKVYKEHEEDRLKMGKNPA